MVEGILQEVDATEYQLWLSDSTANNFRTRIYPEYKANRKNFVKPKHYNFLKDLAISQWGAKVAVEEEADDRLGILQTLRTHLPKRDGETGYAASVIVSIDKDLLQVPGNHYNFVRKEDTFVTEESGRRWFYKQLLCGDTADNLQGVPGIGSVKADAVLGEESTEEGLYRVVRDCYYKQYRDKIFKVKELTEEQSQFIAKQLLVQGICLKIRTKDNEIWAPPLSQTPE